MTPSGLHLHSNSLKRLATSESKWTFVYLFSTFNVNHTHYQISLIFFKNLKGFTWATALDLSMGYYHIVLDTESSYLCMMIVPCGKYCYHCLSMGLNGSLDIFQAIINNIMGNLPNVHAYLDDILKTTANSYEDHLHHVA